MLWAAPCLFGLSTGVGVWFAALPEAKRSGSVAWPGKTGVTFSEALVAVRRSLWLEAVFLQAGGPAVIEKIPEPLRELLLTTLAPAA